MQNANLPISISRAASKANLREEFRAQTSLYLRGLIHDVSFASKRGVLDAILSLAGDLSQEDELGARIVRATLDEHGLDRTTLNSRVAKEG